MPDCIQSGNTGVFPLHHAKQTEGSASLWFSCSSPQRHPQALYLCAVLLPSVCKERKGESPQELLKCSVEASLLRRGSGVNMAQVEGP